MNTVMKDLRNKHGISAYALAVKAALKSEQRVYNLERQRFRPRRDEAERIARILGATVEALFPNGVQP